MVIFASLFVVLFKAIIDVKITKLTDEMSLFVKQTLISK